MWCPEHLCRVTTSLLFNRHKNLRKGRKKKEVSRREEFFLLNGDDATNF